MAAKFIPFEISSHICRVSAFRVEDLLVFISLPIENLSGVTFCIFTHIYSGTNHIYEFLSQALKKHYPTGNKKAT